MGKYLTIAIVAAALAAGVYIYRGGRPAAPTAAEQPAAGLPNAFAGHFGYLLEFPGDYDAYPAMRGKIELVYFFPKGVEPTNDESKYKELGLVRLEVFETPPGKQGAEVIAAVKRGVEQSLRERKETYTARDLALLNGAFLVDITAPAAIKQLFVQGDKVTYMFTGGDEALLLRLAGTIKETGLAGR